MRALLRHLPFRSLEAWRWEIKGALTEHIPGYLEIRVDSDLSAMLVCAAHTALWQEVVSFGLIGTIDLHFFDIMLHCIAFVLH